MEAEKWVIIAAVVIVILIIALSGRSLFRKKTREEYLNDLRIFLKGKLEKDESLEDAYRLTFKFEGFAFEFLDIEDTGFKEKTHKAFLKTTAESDLIIQMTERKGTSIRTKIVRATSVTSEHINTVNTPKELKEFTIYTNNPNKANDFFEEGKVVDVFRRLKSVDSRGYPIMPLTIQGQSIALQFYDASTRKPNIFDLMHSASKIEDYIDDLMILSNALTRVEEKHKKDK